MLRGSLLDAMRPAPDHKRDNDPMPACLRLQEEDLRRINPDNSAWSLDVLFRFGNRGGLRYIDAYNTYRAWVSEYLVR